MLFSTMLDDYYEKSVKRRNKPSTWPGRRTHIRRFKELWGLLELSEITREMVEDWALDEKQRFAAATLIHRLGLLTKAFNWAVHQRLIGSSPAAKLDLGTMVTAKRTRWLKDDEELRLLAQVRLLAPDGEAEAQNVRFAILTGLRRGEQIGLTAEHIDGKVLHVPGDTKRGWRPVSLSTEARRIVEQRIRETRYTGSKFLFWPQFKKSRLREVAQYLQPWWTKVVHAADVTGFQWRDLRRTFGSRLIQGGVSI